MKKIADEHTVDELAKMIRPCIGLTEAQAKANVRFYDNMVATLKEEHPRMSQSTSMYCTAHPHHGCAGGVRFAPGYSDLPLKSNSSSMAICVPSRARQKDVAGGR